jgi:predicted O-methyltransferase YrrM
MRALLNSDNLPFVSGFPPGHFYSPLPDVRDISDNASVLFDQSLKGLDGIDMDEARQSHLLSCFANLYPDTQFPEKKVPEYRYYLDNPYFSFGDGIILGCVLRHFKPKRVTEIGAGFSSAEMLDARDHFLAQELELTIIEPHPDRLYALLSEKDRASCKIQVAPVQAVDVRIFALLEENDILFVDSSHVGKIQSDVLHIIFRILPMLKRGVIVHFHDIIWPFEYPRYWLEHGRAWNEAYLLRAFLQFNTAFEILYFNSFMAIHHSKALQERMPLVLRPSSSHETVGNSSLWLRKKS